MEILHQSINKQFSPVKIYFNDLERIIDIFKNDNFTEIEIVTKTRKYNSDELTQIRKSESISSICACKPFYTCVYFEGNGHIYAQSDSSLAEGVIKKIHDILLRRRRWSFRIFGNFFLNLGILIAAEVLIGILNVIHVIPNKVYYILTLSIWLVIFSSAFLMYPKLIKRNIIYIDKKEERPSFLIKNKDQIILSLTVGIMCTIIGTVAGSLITYYFFKP